MAILGGVPVFNLNILKPNSFKFVLKYFDSFSPCGPPGCFDEPARITERRYVPVVKTTAF